MLRALELTRAGAYYACWAADSADPAERHRAATMAQAFAADELYGVGASLIQVHGGIGFTWEHDAHLYYKRLLTLKELAGRVPASARGARGAHPPLSPGATGRPVTRDYSCDRDRGQHGDAQLGWNAEAGLAVRRGRRDRHDQRRHE